MARIIVIGASTGGLRAAYTLSKEVGKTHEITVVSNTPEFHFVPSNPWVAIGWRKRSETSFPLRERLEKKGARFFSTGAATIDAEKNIVITGGGEALPYDYLVIATGPSLAFDDVPGLGPQPQGHTVSICTVEHAEAAYARYEEFLKDPGPVIIGAAQGASCFGPAYEFACILDVDLRKRRLRKKVPITFVTSEPYIGHMGLAGIGDSKALMEHELRQRHINWRTSATIRRVENGKMIVHTNEAGEEQMPFKYSMIIPAFKGVDAVASVPGLVNPRGFVMVDEHQRSKKYPNVYAVGVCVAIPPVEPTPVPVGVPKTGFMIESMVSAAVRNIKDEINGLKPCASPTLNAVCLADLGDTGVAFVAKPQIPPRDFTWAKKGAWVRLAKIAFEKYYIRKMRRGNAEPFYEKMIAAALKIKKIE
ncbi:MAG: FAD/NAD(P)-binding oxidoreductase [Deltaproteobacteria bacterium]